METVNKKTHTYFFEANKATFSRKLCAFNGNWETSAHALAFKLPSSASKGSGIRP
jgi:hypothetical protein